MIGLVTTEYKAHYDVMIDGKVVTATVRGHFHNLPVTEFPKVGDKVVCESVSDGKVVITTVLPRKNVLSRFVERTGEVQVMVTNVDYLLIVMGLDNNFNVRRLERYLALAEESEVTPVIVCTKKDLVADVAPFAAAIKEVNENAPLHFVSSVTKERVDELQQYVAVGNTAVLLGSSGAGKSSLINILVSNASQYTQSVRGVDDRGRHTTTNRQLFVAKAGGHIIDTPGMRELAVLDPQEAADGQFPEIAELATQCRFRNCDHDKSAGCAILAALAEGAIDETSVRAYFKLARSEERLRRVRS